MEKLTISCINDGKDYDIELGQTLKAVSDEICKTVKDPKTKVSSRNSATLYSFPTISSSSDTTLSTEKEHI